jgi:hypothetical protein
MVVIYIGLSLVLMGWWCSGHHPKAPSPDYIIAYLLKRGVHDTPTPVGVHTWVVTLVREMWLMHATPTPPRSHSTMSAPGGVAMWSPTHYSRLKGGGTRPPPKSTVGGGGAPHHRFRVGHVCPTHRGTGH